MDRKKKEPKSSSQAELKDWYKEMPKKYLLKQHNPNFDKHGLKLPFRMLIVGNSGAGKTQTLLNIIYNMGSTFQNIIDGFPVLYIAGHSYS